MSMDLETLKQQYLDKVSKYKTLRQRRDTLVQEGKQWRPTAIAVKIAKREARDAREQLNACRALQPALSNVAEIKPIHRVKKVSIEGSTTDLYSHVLKMAGIRNGVALNKKASVIS